MSNFAKQHCYVYKKEKPEDVLPFKELVHQAAT